MHLDQIWREYGGALRGFLRKRVANEADVDDLLQDILIKTHAHLSEVRDPAALRAWLFQVARNATVDFYRARAKAQPVNADDLWYGAEEEAGALKDLEGCVASFLAALSDEDAALLRAIDLNGQSQKQVAANMGLAYSTLKSRVQAARGKMAEQYRACCAMELGANGEIIAATRKEAACPKC
ncbi:RNA polymerase sigma factor SigZ [Shimia sagamensis]|uniref:RNA polymerase sigma factor SigZ n=1 Tax=Shimia sagamensis TaxID=1566352 RepID=A0ABY1NMI7_9RHOB|nr:RNA polymerase sigma factor SigZ [Shimia sagamensis]SMP13567.1 RNA polymerase, sigma subunit, SigZ [Shimia sagamensis]